MKLLLIAYLSISTCHLFSLDEKEPLKVKPKEICQHFIELVKKGDTTICLKYVKKENIEMFKKSLKPFRESLNKVTVKYSRIVEKSKTEQSVYFHFRKKEDDFKLKLIDGAWKILGI